MLSFRSSPHVLLCSAPHGHLRKEHPPRAITGSTKPVLNARTSKASSRSSRTISRGGLRQAHDEIVAALRLEPGMAVADVGAGTGLFTRLMAAQVGPKGKVYAVDIAPAFLKHIAAELEKAWSDPGADHPLRPGIDRPPPDSIDLAFTWPTSITTSSTPAKSLASIHQALRTGGVLVVIEFDRVEAKKLRVRPRARPGPARTSFSRRSNPPASAGSEEAGAAPVQGELLLPGSGRSTSRQPLPAHGARLSRRTLRLSDGRGPHS